MDEPKVHPDPTQYSTLPFVMPIWLSVFSTFSSCRAVPTSLRSVRVDPVLSDGGRVDDVRFLPISINALVKPMKIQYSFLRGFLPLSLSLLPDGSKGPI